MSMHPSSAVDQSATMASSHRTVQSPPLPSGASTAPAWDNRPSSPRPPRPVSPQPSTFEHLGDIPPTAQPRRRNKSANTPQSTGEATPPADPEKHPPTKRKRKNAGATLPSITSTASHEVIPPIDSSQSASTPSRKRRSQQQLPAAHGIPTLPPFSAVASAATTPAPSIPPHSYPRAPSPSPSQYRHRHQSPSYPQRSPIPPPPSHPFPYTPRVPSGGEESGSDNETREIRRRLASSDLEDSEEVWSHELQRYIVQTRRRSREVENWYDRKVNVSSLLWLISFSVRGHFFRDLGCLRYFLFRKSKFQQYFRFAWHGRSPSFSKLHVCGANLPIT
ncbi:hypothetical protein FRC02_001894 [Tulasnella sp. 418]|nr:hypothetical protein FRC02_001894 [Tulasnella sp. 418]